MMFTQPCFVRVENPAERKELIEWLKSIGYTTAEYRKGDLYVIATSVTITGEPMCPYARTYPKNVVMPSLYTDCSESVPLFKALAAMNDSNDREQWFIEDIHKPCGIGGQTVGLEPSRKVGQKWFKYEGNDLRVTNHIAFEKENSYHGDYLIRKATAAEIVEHFSNNK